MEHHKPNSELPPIPAKRYFTIGEVSELCGVKAHVLRYWEQEFTQLNPVKRSGNRRYYQHHEVVLIRRIRELLYEQGFTISGARNRLENTRAGVVEAVAVAEIPEQAVVLLEREAVNTEAPAGIDVIAFRRELQEIIALLEV
jgi:DNA-binding transcriptional MerR regulator